MLRTVSGLALIGICIGAFWLQGHPPVAGNGYPPCLLNVVTGLHCPGCGGTRAVYLALRGDAAGAISQNVLVVTLLPLCGWYLLSIARFAVCGVWNGPLISYRLSAALAILMLTFGVLRNLPFAPFDRLAPTPLAANAQHVSDENGDVAGHVGHLRAR